MGEERLSGEAIADRLLAVLGAAGHDPERLTVGTLNLVDQMHLRGLDATMAMIDRLAVGPADRVLDVGCGIGGPARTLAARTGCRVAALDLSRAHCDCADRLNALVGLDRRISVHEADALAMPFPDAGFDAAITHHAAMSIADKPALYAETARVLRPGAAFVLFDVMAGPGGDPIFPLPWAAEPEASHLLAPAAIRRLAAASGFEELFWEDQSAMTVARIHERRAAARARRAAGAPPLPDGAPVLIGGDAREKQRNLLRNLEQGRVTVCLGAFRRAPAPAPAERPLRP